MLPGSMQGRNRADACSLRRSLKVKTEDVCMRKQTSRILHILYVLDTLTVMLLICPWTHHIL